MAERFNLIIFGATGFTGKYAVEEIHKISKKDKSITWAIAGRSHSKLDEMIKDLQQKTGDDLSNIKIIIADVKDSDSLKDMSRQAMVVVNCTGPYRFYGEAVVKACIETQTNHVDVSGETTFIEEMQLKYDEAARKSGVYIISACGFDSIPNDLGIMFLEHNFQGKVNSIESYLTSPVEVKYNDSKSATGNYGTWESLIHEAREIKKMKELNRQLFPEKLPETTPKIKTRSLIHKCEHENLWCLPLIGPDPSTVYRSQRFLYENQKKRPVQFKPYIGFTSFPAAAITLFGVIILFMLAQFKFTRNLLLKYPVLFSMGLISRDGPSEENMENKNLSLLLCAEGWDESDNINEKPPIKKMKARVSGKNPAYGVTCTALIYSAITIVKESDKMPGKGGVLGPAAAFFKTNIIKNLNENGVKFEILN